MPHADLDQLLERALREGVLSREQSARLRAMAHESGMDDSPGVRLPLFRAFNSITVAYAIGAILVLFASGWFLIDRWDKLGAAGVLMFVAVYAIALAALTLWLRRRQLTDAADLTTALTVTLTPLATWSVLQLTGNWPDMRTLNTYVAEVYFSEWHWVVLELTTILVALVVMRARRIVALTYPMALAAFALQLHVARLFSVRGYRGPGDRWVDMTGALALLLIAEEIDRWQRNARETIDGDFANAFWIAGLFAFIIAGGELWNEAGAWRHVLPAVSLGVAWLALQLKRRLMLAAALGGLVVYLGWLTDSVFKNVVSFPLVVAVLGLATIAATVWAQRRFPSLSASFDRNRETARPLPWSPLIPALLPIAALVVALSAQSERNELRLNYEFSRRLQILREHSHREQRFLERQRTRQLQPDAPPGKLRQP